VTNERLWWIAEGFVLLAWLVAMLGGGLLVVYLAGRPLLLAALYGFAAAALLHELMAVPVNRILDYCERRARG
jgi:hypothetical protein